MKTSNNETPQKTTLVSGGVAMLTREKPSYIPVVQRLFLVYSWPVGTGYVPNFCKVLLIKKFKGKLPRSDVLAKFQVQLITF